MTDRNLEEAIFQLQKLNTENGVKHLVEEAAQLFANGRQIEAGALMEKAEAMMASEKGSPAHQKPSTPAGHPDRSKVEERLKVDEQAMANMAGKLADGLLPFLHPLEVRLVCGFVFRPELQVADDDGVQRADRLAEPQRVAQLANKGHAVAAEVRGE